MKLLANLSRWMSGEGLAAAELSPAVVDRYFVWREAKGYRHFRSVRALEPLLAHLRAVGTLPMLTVDPAVCEVDLLIARYRAYLVEERELAAGTVRCYVSIAGRFLDEHASSAGTLDLAGLSAGMVSRYVLKECRSRKPGSSKSVVIALRSLLRFMHVDGLTGGELAAAVPAVAPAPRGLPRGLPPGAVARLLATCDRDTATGCRDFAVLTVLSRLGLRAGEVSAIELGDVDWRAGEFLVRGKARRRGRLPLPVDVGEALVDYLQHGRPEVGSPRMFMRVIAPVGPLSSDAVSGIVRHACRRAGLTPSGAHSLRHTAATEALRAGGSLEEIGQLLRQQTAFTTAIYARVDRAALRELGRRWPEAVR
jgi:integrase/recombinase XerD